MSALVVVIGTSPGRAAIFEMPKSRTLTSVRPLGFLARNRLLGLRSRWTTPAAWTSESPSQAWRMPAHGLGDRELAAQVEEAPEVLPFQELHHHVLRAVLERRHVAHAHDVIALDASDGASLALEARDGLVAVDVLVHHEDLDGHAAVHRHVTRGEHEPHPPFADRLFDAVLAGDHSAGLEGDLLRRDFGRHRGGLLHFTRGAHCWSVSPACPGAPLPPSAVEPALP